MIQENQADQDQLDSADKEEAYSEQWMHLEYIQDTKGPLEFMNKFKDKLEAKVLMMCNKINN